MATTAPHRLSPECKAPHLFDALEDLYGRPKRPRRDPLAVLIRGVLSQNTSDVNSARAYDSLLERMGSWEAIAQAGADAIERSIRSAGLAQQKAGTIQRVMERLGEQGAYHLDHLRDMPPGEAERWLTSIKGVGVKTARLVLLFGFGVPVFVVDTHVLRVSRRLGLVRPNCTRERAHCLLDALVPETRRYSAHMNLIRHGREICHAQRPRCDDCALRQWCVFVRTG